MENCITLATCLVQDVCMHSANDCAPCTVADNRCGISKAVTVQGERERDRRCADVFRIVILQTVGDGCPFFDCSAHMITLAYLDEAAR